MKMIPTDVNYWVSSWWWTTLASIWLPSIPASILLHSTLSARDSRTAFSPASAAGSRGRQWCTCCPWMRSNPASNGSQMASITDWTTAIHVPVINIVHHNSHSMQPSQGRMLILPDTGQKVLSRKEKHPHCKLYSLSNNMADMDMHSKYMFCLRNCHLEYHSWLLSIRCNLRNIQIRNNVWTDPLTGETIVEALEGSDSALSSHQNTLGS